MRYINSKELESLYNPYCNFLNQNGGVPWQLDL